MILHCLQENVPTFIVTFNNVALFVCLCLCHYCPNGLLLNTPGVDEMPPLIPASRKITLGTDIKSPIAVVVPNDSRYKF